MTEQRAVEVFREIKATPEAIFRALTHPLELAYWLCDQAWTEPKAGGDFHVRWRNGWWARGVYQMVERPRRVAFTWQGKDEPGETEVVFELEALDEGTAVKIFHGGYSADASWDKAMAEAEQGWASALENLESVLTTGIDLRQARQPVLGIVPEELTAGRAAQAGVTTESGIYLAGVVENGAAAEAGLLKGDVIISIGGLAVTDRSSFLTTLAAYRAGDRVQVGYVRGLQRGTVQVELKSQPIPKVSFDPRQEVERARKEQAAVSADLRQALQGLSEAEAGKRPSPDEWSVKETLAHLSNAERLLQHWFCDIITGTTFGQRGSNSNQVPEMFAKVFAVAPTVEALVSRWEREMEESLALFAALRPEIVAMRARYRQMADMLQLWTSHAREHLEQIRATIETIRD
jgi:uncharacterized protein YndB with AHSA1/START domain